mgnify:CR=1 FL=1
MKWIIAALLLFLAQIVTVVVAERKRPHKMMAWLTVQFMAPFAGFLAFLFLARRYTHRRHPRRAGSEQLERARHELEKRCRSDIPFDRSAEDVGPLAEHAAFSFAPVTYRNRTDVFAEPGPAFESMLDAMEAATDHIHIEFYIFRDDRIGERFGNTMIRKAEAGVRVRLLYDGMGSLRLSGAFVKRLRDAGIETGCFLPPLFAFFDRRLNYRNHRKILVVDGKIGFFGGLNIGDEYLGNDPKLGYWRDTHIRVEGDAVPWLQHAFLTDWYFVKGEALTGKRYFPLHGWTGRERVRIVKSGPDMESHPVYELFFACIVSAKRRIWIETPYFVPDSGLLAALKTAAVCGVDVRVIIPSVSDSPIVQWATLSYAEELMPFGVRFYRYRKGFLHAKVMIVDELACSGTANMDMRSFFYQFEMHAMFFDPATVKRFESDFVRDLNESEEIVWSEFRERPIGSKIRHHFARLLSPLF